MRYTLRTMLFALVLILLTATGSTDDSIASSRYNDFQFEDECNCGFGGLCAKDKLLEILRRVPCSKICPEVSRGFYNDNCIGIFNHCSSSPCGVKGDCIQSFGGYFCICHRDYFGKNCEIHDKRLTELGVRPSLYVYYQVQTLHNSANLFSVVFDPKVNELKTNNLYIQLVVNISDGRSYYPQMNDHFKRVDVKSECLAVAKRHPMDVDQRVCGYLPSGNLATFTFDPSYYGPLSKSDSDVTIDGFGVIGRKGNVTVFVFVVDKTTRSIVWTLYNHTYHVFTYRHFRVPNHCLMEISFTSCSTDHRFPFVLARGKKIELGVIKNPILCNGSLHVGVVWSLQRHTDSVKPRLNKDYMPVLLSTYGEDADQFEFRSRFFDSGVHMIEYALTIRGRPLHYGGTAQFLTYGRCWIKIITHPPVVRVKGGEMQSVSCYGPMNLELVNVNMDVDINSIAFEATCNNTKDPECDKISLETPAIIKYNTACNTYLEYVVYTLDIKLDPISVYVHFVNYPSSLKIECISNCFPINPNKRLLLMATTERYVPSNVTWNVTRDGGTIEERDGEIRAFSPSTATRMIRMNGQWFCNSTTSSMVSHVQFEARGPRNMHARATTICVNLQFNVNDFQLTLLKDGMTHKFERKVKKEYVTTFPVKYRIFLRNPILLADIQVVETNYEEHLTFIAFWPEAQVCVFNTHEFLACTDWKNVKYVAALNITSEELERAYYVRDFQELLKKSFLLCVFSTQPEFVDGKIHALAWTISPNERLSVVNRVGKVPGFNRYADLVYGIQIVVAQFFSVEGNKAERLLEIGEEDLLTNVSTTIAYLKLRHSALTLFDRLIQARYQMALESPNLPFGPFEFGDLRSLMHFGLALAHIQKGFIEHLKPSRNQTVDRRVQAGMVAFWLWKNNIAYVSAVKWYVQLLAQSTKLFEGIGVYGRYFSRAWAVRSTYKGIIEALTRGSAFDNYDGCASYIFESRKNESEEWLDFIEVQFPPSTIEWEYKELTLVVVAAKNRQNDTTVSPVLLLSMRTKWGERILDLPANQPFNITLPRMWAGVVEPSRHKYFKYTIIKDPGSKDYSVDLNRHIAAFKIELPVEFDSWNVKIQVDVLVPLKIMVTNRIPDPVLLVAKTDLFPTFDSTRGMYLADIKLPPATGKNFVPRYFYLAISPSFETTNVTSIKITLQRTVDVCFVEQSRFLENNNIKRSICKGLTGDLNTIQCNCKQLGLFQALRYPITINRLMLGDIPFTIPQSRFAYENLVITGVLAFLFVATFVIALLMDRSSQNQETLIYVEDNYPSDDYLMVIGVYTGLYFQGGTTSKVGIMLIGEKSSSRVHVLASQKRRTLASGQDDWFVITLTYPPGKITHINLWRDHHDMSGWFCDRIVVYDVSENKFYVATVEKWIDLKISEEVPRVEVIEVVQIDPFDTRGSTRLTSHTFAKNYIREYRNTHDVFSIYTMHTRYLVTYELKSHIIIAKLCFIYFWIWFNQEVGYGFAHGKYFIRSTLTGRIQDLGIEPFFWAFWTALLSHPFTYAIDYYYRSTHLSRVLQKKTTNPFFLGTPSDKRRFSSFSMRPSSKGKASALGKQRRSSFKSHRASSYKSRQTVGSKYANTNVSGLRKGYMRLAVGPSQFRCVDVNSETIALKMRTADRIVRFVSFLIVVAFLGFMVYVQVWTPFTWKWKTCAFVFVLAIIIDVILLSPLLIFIKSSIAFYVYHMNNREPFLMSDDVKVHQPLRTKYENYLKQATRKEYKLPLSSDIEAARRRRLVLVIVKRTVFHILALLAMYCCYEVLMDKYSKQHFILMRIIKDAMTAARTSHGLKGTDPKDVKDFTSAASYVSNTIAALTGIWPNGQRIDSSSYIGTDTRWTYDLFGQGMGSSSVLLLYMDDETVTRTVPLEFGEYFTNAAGHYSESIPEKDSLMVGDTVLNYTILSEMVILGKSLEIYPLAGHLKLIPLKPWEKYYSQMRILMNDAIIKQANHHCRAVIISTNFVYPFVQYLASVDVLIEFLPSGVSDVYIQTRGIKTGAPSHYRMMILRYIITAILFCFSVYTIAVISKVGLREYFRESYNIFKFIIFLTNLATVFCYCLRYPLKYGAIEKLINSAITEYSDVHPIFRYELTDSLFLIFFFTAILIDFMKIVPKLIGTEWLNRFCISTIRITFIVILLQLYLILMVEVIKQLITKTFGVYFILVHTHQPPTNILDYQQREGTSFYICVIILMIMSRFLTSLMIYLASMVKDGTDIPLKKHVEILKRNRLDTVPNNRQAFPIGTIFHKDSRKKSSTESKDNDQKPTSLTMMSDKVASKHRLFF